MNAKMFRVVVLSGAALVGAGRCGPSYSSPGPTPAGNPGDGGSSSDGGGACICQNDPSWPGQDCGYSAATMVCCWLQPNAPCCY
jgi:hypothetical protein